MDKELERLYNTAFDLIEIRLNKKEEVLPFTVLLERKMGSPEIHMYESNGKNTSEQVQDIKKNLKQMGSENAISAMCLCYAVTVDDPRTQKKTDAIQIELANKESGTLNIFVPYNFSSSPVIEKPFQSASDEEYF